MSGLRVHKRNLNCELKSRAGFRDSKFTSRNSKFFRRPNEPDTVSTVEGRNSYRDRSILLFRWGGFCFSLCPLWLKEFTTEDTEKHRGEHNERRNQTTTRSVNRSISSQFTSHLRRRHTIRCARSFPRDRPEPNAQFQE